MEKRLIMTKLTLFLLMTLPLWANAQTLSAEKAAAAKTGTTLNCYQRRPFLQMTMKWDEAGGFHLALLAPEGIEGLPLYNGVVTSYNLSYLQQQKEDLKDWPAVVSLSWAPGSCAKSGDDPWVVECSGPAAAEKNSGAKEPLPAWPYSTSTFFTYRQRQAGVSGEFDARAMTWVVETQGTIYSLGFKFMLNLCE